MFRVLATIAVGISLLCAGPAAAAPGAKTSALAAGPTLDGDWDGTLSISVIKLRLAFHIRIGPDGATGTVDSIDQHAIGIPLSKVTRSGDSVGFEIASIKATFQGGLDPSGESLTGQWHQGADDTPLKLTRRPPGQAQATSLRPQTPSKPFPYREEDIAFVNDAAHVRLAATLTLPDGNGPFPAVVLVAGSGPNTRNEPIFGHQPFLVLADHLTRHGIAVLRYDKRGTGASKGDYATATSNDFADDAEAALAYLTTRREIDPRHIGLIGHSEGGLIVPMVAARNPSTAFIVMMAGPGVNGADVWKEQLGLIGAASGMAPEQIAAASAQRQRLIDILRAENNPERAAVRLRAVMGTQAPPAQIDAAIAQINNKWFREFFACEPAPVLHKVKCPVLVLQGSKDLQVSAAQNLPAIRVALAGNRDVEIDELPNLNHLFQTATTGGVGEYGQIEETIAPVAMDTMTRWILDHSHASKSN
jgi:pimeloyl-ACP methyl ester carboxylesterase